MRRTLGIIGQVLFLIAWINFAVFWVVALSLGGDAVNGEAVDGHFYLANHGKRTEVSQAVWRYSRIHTISVFIVHPIGIFGGGALMIYGGRKTIVGGGS